MTESAPQTPGIPPKDAKTAALLCDRLYHNQIGEILSPPLVEDFLNFVEAAYSMKATVGPARIGVQVFVAETPEELTNPDHMPWFAAVYDVTLGLNGVRFVCQGIVRPKGNEDVMSIPGLRTVPFHSLRWQDVGWDQFDWQTDAHGDTPNLG